MNVFDLPELPLPDELVTVLAENDRIRIERIVSAGQVSDWYDQDETEYVILIEGSADIEYDDGSVVSMRNGDTLLIKPHERHRVSYTSTKPPCIWLCVFF